MKKPYNLKNKQIIQDDYHKAFYEYSLRHIVLSFSKDEELKRKFFVRFTDVCNVLGRSQNDLDGLYSLFQLLQLLFSTNSPLFSGVIINEQVIFFMIFFVVRLYVIDRLQSSMAISKCRTDNMETFFIRLFERLFKYQISLKNSREYPEDAIAQIIGELKRCTKEYILVLKAIHENLLKRAQPETILLIRQLKELTFPGKSLKTIFYDKDIFIFIFHSFFTTDLHSLKQDLSKSQLKKLTNCLEEIDIYIDLICLSVITVHPEYVDHLLQLTMLQTKSIVSETRVSWSVQHLNNSFDSLLQILDIYTSQLITYYYDYCSHNCDLAISNMLINDTSPKEWFKHMESQTKAPYKARTIISTFPNKITPEEINASKISPQTTFNTIEANLTSSSLETDNPNITKMKKTSQTISDVITQKQEHLSVGQQVSPKQEVRATTQTILKQVIPNVPDEVSVTIFISSQETGFYYKPYKENGIYYLHIDDIAWGRSDSFKKLQQIPNLKTINIILVLSAANNLQRSGRQYLLELCIDKLVSLNNKAKYALFVGSCFGIYMHQYIFKFPPGSLMVTLSDYNEKTYNAVAIYKATNQGFTGIYEILGYYIRSVDKYYKTPSIYISNSREIISLFSKIKNHYYLDLYPPQTYPSIDVMKEIFITEGLSDRQLQHHWGLWMTWMTRMSNTHQTHLYKRKHPLDIVKDLNILFQEKNIKLREKEIVSYLNMLASRPYSVFPYSYIHEHFKLQLRVNRALCILISQVNSL